MPVTSAAARDDRRPVAPLPWGTVGAEAPVGWAIGAACAGGVPGYVVGAIAGYQATVWGSGNRHDRAVEAATTAAFVWGPLGALVGAGLAAAATFV